MSLCGAPKFKSLKTKFPGSLAMAPLIMPTIHSKLRHDLDHYFKSAGLIMDIVGM